MKAFKLRKNIPNAPSKRDIQAEYSSLYVPVGTQAAFILSPHFFPFLFQFVRNWFCVKSMPQKKMGIERRKVVEKEKEKSLRYGDERTELILRL